jgi:prepilin-type processing-associated H-X9-DG protein
MKCSNNLKQLGLAGANYITAFNNYPPSVTVPGGNGSSLGDFPDTSGTEWGPNWAILLLPNMEQQALYNTASQSIINNLQGTKDTNWRPAIGGTVLKTLQCPSDPGLTVAFTGTTNNAPAAGWARGCYAANSGPAYGATVSANGQSPSSGPAGGSGSYSAGGVMCPSWGAGIPDIADGTSNTVAFAEVRSGGIAAASDARGTWAIGLLGASVIGGCPSGDCLGPNDSGGNSDDITGCTSRSDLLMGCWSGGTAQANARSAHPGGVNTCFCDGSVHFISNAVSTNIWFYLLSRNDAVAFTTP